VIFIENDILSKPGESCNHTLDGSISFPSRLVIHIIIDMHHACNPGKAPGTIDCTFIRGIACWTGLPVSYRLLNWLGE